MGLHRLLRIQSSFPKTESLNVCTNRCGGILRKHVIIIVLNVVVVGSALNFNGLCLMSDCGPTHSLNPYSEEPS